MIWMKKVVSIKINIIKDVGIGVYIPLGFAKGFTGIEPKEFILRAELPVIAFL